MATTTNYGWTTPDDTALVKDGASAIRTLGSSVDTTTKNLNPETTLADIAYRSSTANVKTRLGIGSTGQVLTVAGGVPTWATPAAGGGMTLIEEKALSAVSSAQFASIPGTYKQLMMVWSGVRHSTSGSQFGLRFNNSSASDYFAGGFGGMGSTVSFVPDTSDAVSINGGGYDAHIFGNQTNTSNLSQDSTGIILIDNYASTSKVKTASVKVSYYVVTATAQQGFNFDLTFNDTTAITTLDIYRVGGSATLSNATNTSIRLYGIS